MPLAHEVLGFFGNSSKSIIRKYASLAAVGLGIDVSAEIARWYSVLAVQLQVAQADILLNRRATSSYSGLSRGDLFLAGLSV